MAGQRPPDIHTAMIGAAHFTEDIQMSVNVLVEIVDSKRLLHDERVADFEEERTIFLREVLEFRVGVIVRVAQV